jgi:hypothetical protein
MDQPAVYVEWALIAENAEIEARESKTTNA